jgi:hypothetical protein
MTVDGFIFQFREVNAPVVTEDTPWTLDDLTDGEQLENWTDTDPGNNWTNTSGYRYTDV